MLMTRRIIAILIIITPVFVLSSNSFAQIKGDANEDGTVTSGDIICVIRGIFGMSCPNPDCNGDGSATSGDVTCVIVEIFN